MALRLKRMLLTNEGQALLAWLHTLPNAHEWSVWRDVWVLHVRSPTVTVRRFCNICGLTESVLGCRHDFVMRHVFHTAVVCPILDRALQGPIDPLLADDFEEASIDASSSHLRFNKRLDIIHQRFRIRSSSESNLSLSKPTGRNPFIESLYHLEAGRRQLARAVREFFSYAVLADWSVDDLDPWVEEVFGHVPAGVHLVQRSMEEMALHPKRLERGLMYKLHWCHKRGLPDHRGLTGNPKLDTWLDDRVASELHNRTMFWVPPTRLSSLVAHAIKTFDWWGASTFVIVADNIQVLDDSVPLPEWRVFPIYDELRCAPSNQVR